MHYRNRYSSRNWKNKVSSLNKWETGTNHIKERFSMSFFLFTLLQKKKNLPVLTRYSQLSSAPFLHFLTFTLLNHTPELYTAKVLPWPQKEVKLFPYYNHYFSCLQHSKALWLLNYFSGYKSTRGVYIPVFIWFSLSTGTMQFCN